MAQLIGVTEALEFLQLAERDIPVNQLEQAILAVENHVQEECRIALTCQEWTEDVTPDRGEYMVPAHQPLIQVVSIFDRHRECDVPAARNWRQDGPFITALHGRWPQGLQRFRVAFVGGYNDGNTGDPPAGSSPAPPRLKTAMLMLLGRWWNARGTESERSAAGSYIDWGALAGGDIAQILDRCRVG